MKKLQILSILILLISFAVTSKLVAEPWIPNIYVSGGYMLRGNGGLKNASLYHIKLPNPQFQKETGMLLSAGIAPHIPLPIIRDFRLQIDYLKNFNNKYQIVQGDLLGAGLYYDIYLSSVNWLTPYIGVSELYYKNITIDNNYLAHFNINGFKRHTQFLTSFNAGLNIQLPFTQPFSIFGEYRYITSTVFNNRFNITNQEPNTLTGDYNYSMVVVGLRLYFM